MGNASELGSQELDLVVEFAREVVAIAAPRELPLVELTAAAYRADPDGSERRVRQGKEILGFGADQLIAVTPFALPVAAAVLQSLLTQFTESFTDVEEAGERARARLRRLLRRSAARAETDDPPEALTAGRYQNQAYPSARQNPLDAGVARLSRCARPARR
jgi:hypothetical protein